MQIGELSQKSQLSRDTIRFYEKKGLITPKRSTSNFNNYKNYTEENLRDLLLIRKAKEFGFTLNEIAYTFSQIEADKANCSLFRNLLHNKLEEIEKKITDLQNTKANILNQLNNPEVVCKNSVAKGNCTRIVNLIS